MVRFGQPLFAAIALASACVMTAAGGCGGSGGSGFNTAGGDDGSLNFSSSGGASGGGLNLGSSSSGGGGTSLPCDAGGMGWKCKVDTSCSSPTTLTGKVFDPAGLNPLYNVIVFIPNVVASLPAITPGTHTCNTCDVSLGDYVAATTTDYTGSFSLKGVPAGTNVPVTVQIGKWRRTVPVNIPNACGTNTVNNGTLRLPRRKGEGDLPQMAVLTGGCDDLGCFMTGMGIDPTEFTAPHGGGRIDVYQGSGLFGGTAAGLSNGTAGNCSNAGCPLWASKSSFEYYDMALFSCECGENNNSKPAASMQALHDWLNEGGKVFASHYHYTWFENSPAAEFKAVATWGQTGLADTASGGNSLYDIDVTFPKGMVFSKWLGVVNALQSAGPPPDMTLYTVADSVNAVNKTAPQATVQWIYDTASGNHPKYISFGTPIGGATGHAAGAEPGKTYCGKAVFTDLHTSGAMGSGLLSTVADIPGGCTNKGLTPQQKALEFLFFDLSACVSNDNTAPPMLPPPQ